MRPVRPYILPLLFLGALVPSIRAQGSTGENLEGDASDYTLVKALNEARDRYRVSLEKLRAHYIRTGDLQRARWAEEELKTFHRTPKQSFRLDMELPPEKLKAPLKNSREANTLYRRAMAFKNQGWGIELIDNQRRAELLFQQLISKYPLSDKVPGAAYQLGDIYENKPYNQYRRAAEYFRRCYLWDSNTQWDARLRAARLYQEKLNEYDEARRIYRLVLEHETDPKNRAEAAKALGDLGR